MLQEGRNEIAINKAFIYSCCCLRTAAAFGRFGCRHYQLSAAGEPIALDGAEQER